MPCILFPSVLLVTSPDEQRWHFFVVLSYLWHNATNPALGSSRPMTMSGRSSPTRQTLPERAAEGGHQTSGTSCNVIWLCLTVDRHQRAQWVRLQKYCGLTKVAGLIRVAKYRSGHWIQLCKQAKLYQNVWQILDTRLFSPETGQANALQRYFQERSGTQTSTPQALAEIPWSF